ncbi:MAG: pilus assembly protein PilM, partial [Planctomycetota bacterium]
LDLRPNSKSLQTLSGQLCQKSLRRANKKYARGDYAGAAKLLEMIPNTQRDQAIIDQSERVCKTLWLSKQFDDEPFASPTLGRLAMAFAEDRPQDDTAAGLVKQLSQLVKGKRPSMRDGLASFRGQQHSWLGGELGVLASPQSFSIDTGANERAANHQPPPAMTRYGVAIGLALHGLGLGRVGGNLLDKPGLLAKLTRGKSRAVWGIDVGASSIQAIRMELSKNQPQPKITRCVRVDIESPSCRGANADLDWQPILASAIAKLLEQIDTEDAPLASTPVWSNLPTADSVARFSELPPVKDKEVTRLIEQEVKGRVPIPADELALMQWHAPRHEASGFGRPLTIVAATKRNVATRVDLLGSAGLKIQGLVPEAIALANYAIFEFADMLEPDAGDKSRRDKNPSTEVTPDEMPALAMIDAGAAKTLLVIVSPIAVWFWSQENGGEDINSVLTRFTALTAGQAERGKQNLGQLDQPDKIDDAIAEKQDALRLRLQKLADEAGRTFPHLNVQQTWVVGGAQMQHGFHRRVLMATSDASSK